MVSGEFASMTALHNTVPDLVPAPIAWGTYASDPDVHFFLCSFIDMKKGVPEIQPFVAKVAELHQKGVSPNGRYGFPVPTYGGTIPQETAWTDSWEQFFTNSMKRWLAAEEESQGFDIEMKRLSEALFSKVIPRLLRPLETGGRKIQPRLVHGDLWDGNASTDTKTDKPVIFDASCLYAHNEGKSEIKDYAGCAEVKLQLSWHHGDPPDTRLENPMSMHIIRFSSPPSRRKTRTTETLSTACKS